MITEVNVDRSEGECPHHSGVSMLFALLSVVTALCTILYSASMD